MFFLRLSFDFQTHHVRAFVDQSRCHFVENWKQVTHKNFAAVRASTQSTNIIKIRRMHDFSVNVSVPIEDPHDALFESFECFTFFFKFEYLHRYCTVAFWPWLWNSMWKMIGCKISQNICTLDWRISRMRCSLCLGCRFFVSLHQLSPGKTYSKTAKQQLQLSTKPLQNWDFLLEN